VRGILKRTIPADTLIECLRAVAEGNLWVENSISNQAVGFRNRKTAPRLTAREQEIVQLVCRGFKNRQIAQELSITPGTVKVHLMHVFEKTGVTDRYELALRSPQAIGPGLAGCAGAPREIVNG
jgi:DNA-binding NarL/FixJ family response regulator